MLFSSFTLLFLFFWFINFTFQHCCQNKCFACLSNTRCLWEETLLVAVEWDLLSSSCLHCLLYVTCSLFQESSSSPQLGSADQYSTVSCTPPPPHSTQLSKGYLPSCAASLWGSATYRKYSESQVVFYEDTSNAPNITWLCPSQCCQKIQKLIFILYYKQLNSLSKLYFWSTIPVKR